ncbi:transposase [Methylobacterium sp. UNC378MF]|uniref:transposase n=1 Tax=Methylobacterium sp. UNC378MF TaxID=1502748 RepID=UPI001FCD6922|nr:transposase [Methylobacterium sp. UNC378MF]
MLADARYGSSAAFRHGLEERHLGWAVGILPTQKVFPAEVMLVPSSSRGRKPVPDQEPRGGGRAGRVLLAARYMAPGTKLDLESSGRLPRVTRAVRRRPGQQPRSPDRPRQLGLVAVTRGESQM